MFVLHTRHPPYTDSQPRLVAPGEQSSNPSAFSTIAFSTVFSADSLKKLFRRNVNWVELEMAPIAVGDSIPDVTLSYLDDDNQSQKLNTHQDLKGKKVVLVAVPGAFTPTCSQKHVPGFIDNAKEIKSKGVSDIIVVSVNDPFVMKAWERSYDGAEHLKFVADGSLEFTKALGLELDLTDKGLGVRSRRFCLLVDDLVVKVANIEEGGAFTVSGAEEILKALE